MQCFKSLTVDVEIGMAFTILILRFEQCKDFTMTNISSMTHKKTLKFKRLEMQMA